MLLLLLFIIVWLVSITQQKKGWYSWLYSVAGTIKTNQNSFFWWQQHYCHCLPLPQTLHTETVQFYPWSKFYFLLFQTHYHTLPYPKTYLPWQQPASAVDSADSLFLTSPSPLSPTVNSLNNPITGWRINRVNKILALLCAVH